MTEYEEDVTFSELVDELRNRGVHQDVIVAVAGYVGTIEVQAWHRGLRQGIEKQRHRQEIWHDG